jgi:hypothetical protein
LFNVILVKAERPPLQKSAAWLIEPTDRARDVARRGAAVSSDDRLSKVNQAFLCNPHKIAFIPETMRRDGLARSGSTLHMKKVFLLAVIGAACSSVAFAAEVKKEKAHVAAVKATTMSDADMDKVTAGSSANIFLDGLVNPTVTNETGSAFQGNLNGALNVNFHIANPHGFGSH